MSAIHDLIAQVTDPRLRQRLAAEWANAAKQKKFGLVFEDHLPELLPLHGVKPRKGDLVCRKNGPLKAVWQVKSLYAGMATCIKPNNQTQPSEPTRAAAEAELIAMDDLLVVREFGEPIFPALMPVDAVANGPADAPWHTLIEADNYHALQLLDYLYAGQVDCIYIDPPYNTGARDWKYNNDYVDSNDNWRHSKWLAFMEKRLRLAKRLLKPDTGVLIVTIDEHEAHHLRMLIERELTEARLQMVTIVNNGAGVSQGGFYRVEEYAYFCFLGTAKPFPSDDDKLSDPTGHEFTQYWFSLIRYGGINALPSKRPNLVYPIAINDQTLQIVSVGKSLKVRVEEGDVPSATNDWLPRKEEIGGHSVIWPFRGNGSMATWQMNEETLMGLYQKGFVRVNRHRNGPGGNKYSISYVKSGHRDKVDAGVIPVIGRENENGPLLLGQSPRNVVPKTVWRRAKHDAGKWGSRVLREALGDVAFDYAKSPYAVADCLSAAVGGVKDALVLDFFSGSGTTLNAVNLLNVSDGGQRRCILVTNNEVSAEESAHLTAQGLQPGDEDWEAQGICRSVTWPRSKYTILGRRDDGTVLTGEYLTGKSIEREKPRSFTQIGFCEPASLSTLAKKKQVVSLS
jgi:adenine-specific DNA-methyltransferase